MPVSSLTVVPDGAALAHAAAEHFIASAAAAIAARGVAHIALAGGSTPRAMNALLSASPLRERIDWRAVRFYFSDERCVPPDHAESNYRMTRETLFEPLAIDPSHVFRMRGEDAPPAAAQAYDVLLERELGPASVFDLIMLGMGPDGHTASLFPGTIASIDATRRTVTTFVSRLASHRLTLTPRVINAARDIAVTAGGAEKSPALEAVLHGTYDPDRYPAQLIAPDSGNVGWYVDEAAAAQLSSLAP